MKKRKLFLTSVISILSLISCNNPTTINKPSNSNGSSLPTSDSDNTNDTSLQKLVEMLPVVDYDKKIEIWGNCDGKTNASKLEKMNIDYTKGYVLAMKEFLDVIVGNEYNMDAEKKLDSFTYAWEIDGGYEKETYTDTPYLIPYIVDDKNADSAVIVLCGGGFCYKSMDGGGTGETKDIALSLNKEGINAFVLHYRSNPYEYPIPYLDLQRAIRYVRYHATDYHLDVNKISIIGGSAGGNLSCTYINKIMGNDLFSTNYVKDDIDKVDDKISTAAMLYPAVSFNDNVNMLFAMFDSKKVKNETERAAILNDMDMVAQFNSSKIKQFVSYGTKDELVGTKQVNRYIDKAKEENTEIEVVVAEDQKHGFDQQYYFDKYISWLKTSLTNI